MPGVMFNVQAACAAGAAKPSTAAVAALRIPDFFIFIKRALRFFYAHPASGGDSFRLPNLRRNGPSGFGRPSSVRNLPTPDERPRSTFSSRLAFTALQASRTLNSGPHLAHTIGP